MKYDITFETEKEVFVSYGKPPHIDYVVKFNHITFIEDTGIQELNFEYGERVLINMIIRGTFLSAILNNVLKNEKIIIPRDNINLFDCNSDAVYCVESWRRQE